MDKTSGDIKKEKESLNKESLKIKRIKKIDDYAIFKGFKWEDSFKQQESEKNGKQTKRELNKFQKHNLFYGWNGSGKSTLSRLFSYLEKKDLGEKSGESGESATKDEKIANAGVVFEVGYNKNNAWEIDFKTIKDNPNKKLPQVKVFNKDFVKNNVFMPTGEAKGIVLFGEENIDKQNKLDGVRKNLDELEEKIKKKTRERKEKEDLFTVFKTEKATTIRAAIGIVNTQTYSAVHFARDCKSMLSLSAAELKEKILGNKEEELKEEEPKELKKLKELVRNGAQEKEGIPKLNFSVKGRDGTYKSVEFNFSEVNEINQKVTELCKEVPPPKDKSNTALQGSSAEDAIDEPSNEDGKLQWEREHVKWLSDGITHQENTNNPNPGDCLFCQQKLPKGLIQKINEYLKDDAEKRKQEKKQLKADADRGKVTALQQKLEALKDRVADIVGAIDESKIWMVKTQELEAQEEKFKENKERFNDVYDEARTLLKKLEEELNNKLNNLPTPIEIKFAGIEVKGNASEMVKELNRFIDIANEKITTDNENSDSAIETAKGKLKDHYIATNLKEYEGRRDGIKTLEKKLKDLEEEKKETKTVINKLSSEINNVERSAKNMNKDLEQYFGRKELAFDDEEGNYKIKRNGIVVQDDLSEGEQTAIAFIYFLQTLSEDEFDLGKGVVVIDDPISSLDESGLYNAFRLTKMKTKDAGQLFVFTHNFSFFKKIRRWFKQTKDNNNYYMVSAEVSRDKGGKETRVSQIKELDKYLKDYDSEYHYLFSLVYNAAKSTSQGSFIDNYPLPNVARKLLESFLALQYPGQNFERKSLYDLVKKITNDTELAGRFVSFFNDFSHGKTTPNDTGTQGAVPDQDLKVILKDLLKLIKNENEKHYESMERLMKDEKKAS